MEENNGNEDILSLSSAEEDPYHCSDNERDVDYVEDKTEQRKRTTRLKKKRNSNKQREKSIVPTSTINHNDFFENLAQKKIVF